MERLTGVTLFTHSFATLPQGSDEILSDILTYGGVDSARRQLDQGKNLVPSSWTSAIWSAQGTDEIHRLQDEEDGLVYVDGHGFWRLEGRSHRSSSPHSAPLETIKDTDDGVNPYFSDLAWDDGNGNIENMVFMRVGDATDQGAQTVWTLTEKPSFSASETKDFLAESKSYDAMTGLTTPVDNTDYDANTAQDGSGSDISSELTVTHPSTSDYHGKGTLIRVTFGATAGYLTLLKLRSPAAFTFDDRVLLLAEDATSKSAHGKRIRSIDALWTREVAVAQATVDNRLSRRKDPKTVLTILVPNGSKANVMLMLQRSFSDRVTVDYSDMGISSDFFIEGHKITVSEGWTSVVTELLLQGV